MRYIKNCSCYKAVKLLEHGMKVVEFEKSLWAIVTVNEMQFGFMPERGIIDATFILMRLQEEYHAKGKKLYMCFLWTYRKLLTVPRKVLECAMQKKGVTEVLVRSVMSLYYGAKIRVRVDSELSEELRLKWDASRICAVITAICLLLYFVLAGSNDKFSLLLFILFY